MKVFGPNSIVFTSNLLVTSDIVIPVEPKKVESVTCSIKTEPDVDYCQARKKRTLATIVDSDGFPHYNYQQGPSDTKDS